MRSTYTEYKAVELTPKDKILKFSEVLEKVISSKFQELKEIFREEGKGMDWKRIVIKSREDYDNDDFGW